MVLTSCHLNDCQYPICFNSTYPEICSGNGNCTAPNVCNCSSGFTGPKCEVPICFGLNANDPLSCNGKGYCVSKDICDCRTNHSGEQCQYHSCFSISANVSNVCNAKGSCISENNCSCYVGFYGQECQYYYCFDTPFNDTAVCSSHGSCVSTDLCLCHTEHYGIDCEYFITSFKARNRSIIALLSTNVTSIDIQLNSNYLTSLGRVEVSISNLIISIHILDVLTFIPSSVSLIVSSIPSTIPIIFITPNASLSLSLGSCNSIKIDLIASILPLRIEYSIQSLGASIDPRLEFYVSNSTMDKFEIPSTFLGYNTSYIITALVVDVFGSNTTTKDVILVPYPDLPDISVFSINKTISTIQDNNSIVCQAYYLCALVYYLKAMPQNDSQIKKDTKEIISSLALQVNTSNTEKMLIIEFLTSNASQLTSISLQNSLKLISELLSSNEILHVPVINALSASLSNIAETMVELNIQSQYYVSSLFYDIVTAKTPLALLPGEQVTTVASNYASASVICETSDSLTSKQYYLANSGVHLVMPSQFWQDNGTLFNQMTDNRRAFLKIVIFNYNPHHENAVNSTTIQQVSTQIASVTMYWDDGTLVEFVQLVEPLELFFPGNFSQRNSSFSCCYWDIANFTWSSQGCLLFKIVEEGIYCHCNHTTDFAIIETFAKIISPDISDTILDPEGIDGYKLFQFVPFIISVGITLLSMALIATYTLMVRICCPLLPRSNVVSPEKATVSQTLNWKDTFFGSSRLFTFSQKIFSILISSHIIMLSSSFAYYFGDSNHVAIGFTGFFFATEASFLYLKLILCSHNRTDPIRVHSSIENFLSTKPSLSELNDNVTSQKGIEEKTGFIPKKVLIVIIFQSLIGSLIFLFIVSSYILIPLSHTSIYNPLSAIFLLFQVIILIIAAGRAYLRYLYVLKDDIQQVYPKRNLLLLSMPSSCILIFIVLTISVLLPSLFGVEYIISSGILFLLIIAILLCHIFFIVNIRWIHQFAERYTESKNVLNHKEKLTKYKDDKAQANHQKTAEHDVENEEMKTQESDDIHTDSENGTEMNHLFRVNNTTALHPKPKQIVPVSNELTEVNKTFEKEGVETNFKYGKSQRSITKGLFAKEREIQIVDGFLSTMYSQESRFSPLFLSICYCCVVIIVTASILCSALLCMKLEHWQILGWIATLFSSLLATHVTQLYWICIRWIEPVFTQFLLYIVKLLHLKK